MAASQVACGEEEPTVGDDLGDGYPGYDAGSWSDGATGDGTFVPDGTPGDGSFADGEFADGSDPADGEFADGSSADGSSADGSSASDAGVPGEDIGWEDIFPPPPDGGTPTQSSDLKPLPDNVPECPPTAPENPVGLCIGVPIYAFCGYTDGINSYNCICDWYHWLCSPL